MSLDTNISMIVIDSNTFDYGSFTPDGSLSSSATKYGYDWCIFNVGDCIATNNYFGGINVNGINVQNAGSTGSATLTNNIFIRGNNSISSYIKNTSANDCLIVDNVFDSPTVDGSNETLTTGLSPNSTYHSNKNQTGYRAIYKSNCVTSFTNTPFIIGSEESAPFVFNNKEFANYTVFGTAGEAMKLNYIVPFAQPVGNPQFTVVYGSSFVTCSGFTVPGVFSSIDGLLVQFNDNGDFYRVINASGSGSNVTGFQLQAGLTSPTPTAPIGYAGVDTGTASAKFFSAGGSPSLTVVNTPTSPMGDLEVAVDINNLLPMNVQILSLVVGVWAFSGSSSITGGVVILSSSTSQSAQYSLSSLSGTIVDVRNSSDSTNFPTQISTGFIIGFGGGQITPTQLANATQYVQLDTSGLTTYITEKNKMISVKYSLVINVDTSGPVTVVDSPLVIRYRW